MDIIFLENPESVSKETTIFNEEQKFFRVYDFSSKKNTKITYKGKGISKEEAINLIKYEGIECRLFDNNVKKKQKKFTPEREEFILGTVIIVSFIAVTFILGKS